MKNKKGFTLIELLAIIVILAIIALIAIPVVLNIIDKVRVSSYARSADNILETTRIYFKETQIDSTMSIEGNNYDKVMVSIAGRKPDSGEIYIKKSGEIALALKYSKYCYKKGYSDVGITQTESEDCSLSVELDENAPIITANSSKINACPNYTNDIITHFTVDQNGAASINSTTCTSDKDGNVANAGNLSAGTHIITCTTTKSNGKSASASIEVEVGSNKIGETTIAGVTVDVVDSCDGLYLDDDGVYRYKGQNPNNYITLGTESYRILSVEDQGIKVISSTNAARSTFDNTSARSYSTHTYCYNSERAGCNAWTYASNIIQNGETSSTLTNGKRTGTVRSNSTIYSYLYNTYYPKLDSVQKYIVEDAIWNIGPVKKQSPTLLNDAKLEEKQWTWIGKIGLITLSEYVQAQSTSSVENTSCISNILTQLENKSCGRDNWILQDSAIWLITPIQGNSDGSFGVNSSGGVDFYGQPKNQRYVRPVVYLTKNITLSGTGEQGENAFKIVEPETN